MSWRSELVRAVGSALLGRLCCSFPSPGWVRAGSANWGCPVPVPPPSPSALLCPFPRPQSARGWGSLCGPNALSAGPPLRSASPRAAPGCARGAEPFRAGGRRRRKSSNGIAGSAGGDVELLSIQSHSASSDAWVPGDAVTLCDSGRSLTRGVLPASSRSGGAAKPWEAEGPLCYLLLKLRRESCGCLRPRAEECDRMEHLHHHLQASMCG